MKRSLLLLAFYVVVLAGCSHYSEYTQAHQQYRTQIQQMITAASTQKSEVCAVKFTQGGSVPAGTEFNCSVPTLLLIGHQLQQIQPPQIYQDPWPGVFRDIALGGFSSTVSFKGIDSLLRFGTKAIEGAGGNTTTSIADSYKDSSTKIDGSDLSQKSGDFSQRSGDFSSKAGNFGDGVFNTGASSGNDRDKDKDKPTDNHSVYQSPYQPASVGALATP